MVNNDNFCGTKFAFDLPEDHPAFLDGDGILFDRAYALHDMCNDLEFIESDFAGAKVTAIFEYDGDLEEFPHAYDVAMQWLNEMYEGYEADV